MILQDTHYINIEDTSLSRRVIDENGYLIVKDNPIATAGVHEYLLSDISEVSYGTPDDVVVKVFKSPDNLRSIKDSFSSKPIKQGHEWIGKYGSTGECQGCIGETVSFKDGKLYSNLHIYDSNLISQIERGECRQLSPGYKTTVKPEQGVYEGQEYSYVMDIQSINHVAVVPRGRAGNALRILDEKNKGIDVKELNNVSKNITDSEATVATNQKITDSLSTGQEATSQTTSVERQVEIEKKTESRAVMDESTIKSILDSDSIKAIIDASVQAKVKSMIPSITQQITDEAKAYNAKIMDAVNTVQSVIGSFNYDGLTTPEAVYSFGYEQMTGHKLQPDLDSRTAFSILAGKSMANNVAVTDSVQAVSVYDEESRSALAEAINEY